jgi:hypothetical protein
MPITLDDPNTGGTRSPILKRRAIGETFTGALVKTPEQRDILKDGQPVLKDNGKPRQELVITLVALPGATMAAGIGDTPPAVPAAGDVVRTILKGLAFSQYIEAKNSLGGSHQVGDIFTLTTTHGQAYDANGRPSGGQLNTQAECDAVPRQQTLGMYGDITVRRATAAEAQWVQMAEAEYLAQTATPLPDAAPAATPTGF